MTPSPFPSPFPSPPGPSRRTLFNQKKQKEKASKLLRRARNQRYYYRSKGHHPTVTTSQLGEARQNVLPQVHNVPTGSSKLEAIEKRIDALKKLERNAQDDADDGRLDRFKRKRQTLEDELFDQL
jgi:hypothetical protein